MGKKLVFEVFVDLEDLAGRINDERSVDADQETAESVETWLTANAQNSMVQDDLLEKLIESITEGQ